MKTAFNWKSLNEEMKKSITLFWYLGWAILAVLVAVLLLLHFKLILLPSIDGGCIFRSHFSIYCPGCGGTRSLLALSEGLFITAILYHPAVPLAILWLIIFLFSNLLKRMLPSKPAIGLHFHLGWLIIFISLCLLNSICKNMGILLLR